MAARRRHVVTDSDDEDDDVPIAALAAKHQIAAPAKPRPAAAAAAAAASAKVKKSKKKHSSSSGDYSAKRSKTKGASAGESRSQSSSGSRSRSSTPTRAKAASSSSASKSKKYADFTPGKAGNRELDKDWPLKHQAIEAILCRWPYSGLPYPPPDLDTSVEEGFMALPGLPGVSVGIAAHNMGEVRDKRPAEPRPSMAFLLTLKSETIATMYRRAVEGQMAALLADKGERVRASRLYKSLAAELVRTVVLIERLAPKLDGQAAKHEQRQGRPELAAAILASRGEAALARAGGLAAAPKREAKAEPAAPKREAAAAAKAEPTAKADPATKAADAEPVASDS